MGTAIILLPPDAAVKRDSIMPLLLVASWGESFLFHFQIDLIQTQNDGDTEEST